MPERVGFIGLGIMGKPMAANLLAGDVPLTVHSRSAPPVDAVVALGATRADSARAVAEASTVIITMLPDTPDVEQVLFGPGGVAEGAAKGALVIDMSSIEPVPTRAFAARLGDQGVDMLDAPVSGGERGAIEGTLSIMVGGDPHALERAMPYLQTMGGNIVHVGASGAGQITKACNQLVVGANIESVAEALCLAEQAGVDPAKVREALLGGFAASKVLDVHGQRMLDGAFQPGFRARMHLKDARIVNETAAAVGASVPSFEAVTEQFQRLVDSGGGDLDHSALYTVLHRDPPAPDG